MKKLLFILTILALKCGCCMNKKGPAKQNPKNNGFYYGVHVGPNIGLDGRIRVLPRIGFGHDF